MLTFSIGDTDYIGKLNQLASDSTNAAALRDEMEQLRDQAQQALSEQQSIASAPINWNVTANNHRLQPSEKLVAVGTDQNVFFPSSIKVGEAFELKALVDNVIVRPEGYTLVFPKQTVTSPNNVRLNTGDYVHFVATTSSRIEVIE